MMMNFLDLSAVSEEERRLISEILSDTSVVNFAEPLTTKKQQAKTNQQRPQNLLKSSVSTIEPEITSSSSDTLKINININDVSKNSSSGASIRNQAFLGPQDNSTPTTHHNQNSLHNNINNTSNLSQATSNVPPPQALATQLPSPLAGDVNSVINMDLTSTQPPGYAIPPPPPTHVSAYGPPPAHHVYSGPPIFQPYPHYLMSYLPHFPMPYVMPTNSVVPTRQQVPPQSNQPSNVNMSAQHTRSHPHHSRTNKVKDAPRQHNMHQHHQQHHHQHSPAQQQEFRNNSDLTRKHVDAPKQLNNFCHDENVLTKIDRPVDINKELNNHPKSDIAAIEEVEANIKNQQRDSTNVTLGPTNKHINEEETIKVSSDEGFDTQSSLDVSKQSHEFSLPNSDASKSPGELSNSVVEEVQTETETVESNATEKHQPSTSDRAQNVTSSSASKSWASLFKGDRSSGPTINGENEPGNSLESENFDEENRAQKESSRTGNNVKCSDITGLTKEQRSQEIARRALDKMAPRLAQRINSINLKHSLPLLRPRGFINKGNGCYINSTLQALIACPPFYNLMKEIGDLRGIRRDNSCTPILDSFADLFLNFPPLDASKKGKQSVLPDQKLQMNYLQAEAIEPKCIYNVLGKIKSECLKGAQEDAEEFLSSVLNGLHEEMIGLSEALQSSNLVSNNQNGHLSDSEDLNGDSNNDDNLWREVGPKNRSLPIRTAPVINTPIQEIFGGSLFSIRTAGKDRCGHRSPFFDLQLDISSDNVKTLQDAIKSFTATEIIQDFYCSKTKQKLDAQRRTSLDQLPPILILHLKQFVYTQDHGLRKLMKKIEYPIDFELPDSCLHDKNSDKSLRNSRTYKLLAVVYHEGKEAYKGHYLTDVYHIGSSQWIRCDDSNLKVVPLPRIENPESSRTPYLLFYRRLNTLGPPQSNRYDTKKKRIE